MRHSGFPFLFASLVALCGVPLGAAQSTAPLIGEFNAGRALVEVYGSLEVEDPRIERFARFQGNRAHVEPLFDTAFQEGGATKHLVIATLTPRPKREFSCHACSPILGGAVFRRDGDAWVRESTGELIQLSNAWHTSLSLMQVGPDRHALLHLVDDIHGGMESKHATLIFGVGGELAVRFRADGIEAPGPGACALPTQHLTVKAVTEANRAQEYFDLVVDAKWNDATCRTSGEGDGIVVTSSGKECRRVSRYRFREGSYQPLATDVDECKPLEDKTVALKG